MICCLRENLAKIDKVDEVYWTSRITYLLTKFYGCLYEYYQCLLIFVTSPIQAAFSQSVGLVRSLSTGLLCRSPVLQNSSTLLSMVHQWDGPSNRKAFPVSSRPLTRDWTNILDVASFIYSWVSPLVLIWQCQDLHIEITCFPFPSVLSVVCCYRFCSYVCNTIIN